MVLGIPLDTFIGIVLILTTFLVAGYLLLKQALVSAHFEIKEREERERRQR